MKISKNDVFYTKIKGEVYAMRFKALLVDMNELSERELEFNDGMIGSTPKLENATMTLFKNRFSLKGIKYIVAEFAPTGDERIWNRSVHVDSDYTFNPYAIYTTIEDCVNEVNPLFVRDFDYNLRMKDDYCVSLDDITPSNIAWENSGYNIYGCLTYRPYTYIWDGSKAVRKRVTLRGNYLGYSNLNANMLYDIITEQLIFDDKVKEIGYSSKEECCRHNAVQVHLFTD